MLNSTRESEPSDYQNLYRKHVHENMLLHERLKNMDNVEKSKLRELNNDTAMFKSKYLKYVKDKRNMLQDSDKGKSDTKQCKHRSAFLVCKNFAYPAKTWHNLVDVSKFGLDVYKTEVLKNNVGERPESEPRATQVIHRNSTGLLNVYRAPEETITVTSPRNVGLPSYAKSELEKSQTIPTIVLPLDGTPRTLSGQKGLVNSAKSKSENNLHSCDLPRINETSNDRERRMSNSRRPPVTLSPRDNTLELPEYRGRCHTVGTTSRPTALLERRRSSARRHSIVATVSETGSGWQKLKKKAKLISVSLSLLHDARETEIKKTAKSFEDLSHCRYLRLADDKTYNEGRDNLTYSREKLNSSSEDLQ